MGTEILPKLLLFLKIIVGAVGVIGLLSIIMVCIEYSFRRSNKKRQEELKDHIVHGLTAVTIALLAYFILSAIGPVFRLLFSPS